MPHNEERRRRVLMVAYHFPPLGGGGVQRTAKYVKYMPSAGFDPVVVAGSAHAFVLHDEAAGRDIPPGTPVMRARALPLYRAQWMLDGLFRRLGLPRKLLNEVLWPDEFVGWLPAAVVQGMRMAKAYQPQVLYTTSLPATAHLAGMMLQRMTGLPWVADFRDAYTMNPLHTRGRGHVTGAASEALERAVAERASYVTFADETMHIKGLRGEDPRRVVITNGVDEDDLRELEHGTVKSGRFRLSYVGSLYGRHDGGPVFDAMRDLLREGAIDADSIEVRIVGHAAPESRSRLDGLPVTFTGYASHRQALEEMASATVLLYSRPAGDLVMSGKIFEYLCSGRPVLCVADPASLAYKLVDDLGGGICVSVYDETGIKKVVAELIREVRRDGAPISPAVREEVLMRFSRRRLAARLAAVLRAAADGDGFTNDSCFMG